MGAPRVVVAAALLTGGCAGHCGARGGLPPNRPPLVRLADGREYHLLDKGPYKAFYDRWGRIQRLEYDSNGDGKPDQIALHDGRKVPHEVDVDSDFDGKTDRWEEYDPEGRVIRVGISRRNDGRPDEWTSFGPDGQPQRRDHDDDGDGRPERSEFFAAGGRLERAELDTDRNGRPDRWQTWHEGRLVSEDLDTDGDGKPDRRLRYGADGRVLGLEVIVATTSGGPGQTVGR
jgi:hypothetical protein